MPTNNPSLLMKPIWKFVDKPSLMLKPELIPTLLPSKSVTLKSLTKKNSETLLKLTETKPKKNLKSKLPDGTLMSLLTKT